ncbi:hypothetical protein [[Leptolyngbya] sp. PCC 7376]|nr:hypothetical protein [[Leptolyngbya] sp. PCC 7376]
MIRTLIPYPELTLFRNNFGYTEGVDATSVAWEAIALTQNPALLKQI